MLLSSPGETNTSQLNFPLAGLLLSFTLFAQLFLKTIKGGVLGHQTRPTVVDCVVCELSLAEDAGGAPRIQNCFFLFFSSLLVVACILRLDLLVREHTTPAP